MGAEEILKILASGEKLTSTEIAKRSENGTTTVKKSIKRLLNDHTENVCYKVLTPEEKEERYGKKISCKVYLYWLEK